MKNRWMVFTLLLTAFTLDTVFAQSFLEKKEVSVGKEVPDFQLSDAEGKAYRLSDYRGKHVMIHFWSATCPFVVRYEDRLQAMTSDYADQDVVVLGIDSNVNETPKQIKKVAKKRKVNYPILLDPDSGIADLFGAITTPHVFILNKKGKLVYEGSVDDQGWSEDNPVTKNYARDVIEALMVNKKAPYTQTNSFGCTIKRQL